MRKSNSSSGAWAEIHGTLGDVTKGEPGKSAYEIAVEHGFEGTEEEWLAYVQANADRAVSAENAAVAAKEAAQYASDEAQGHAESASTSAGVAHSEAESAAESAARAEAAATSAGESRDGAAMSAVDAADSATAAAASATEAARQALLATGRADEARQSQIDAHVSEVHVEEMYVDIMSAPVVVEEQTRQAIASAQAAAQSATAAAGSATASASSATAAANSAGDSSDSATAAAASAQAAAQSASQTAAMLDTKLGKTETAVNAEKVNNLTVETAVPPNAVFTDTTYQQMTDQELDDGISTQGRVVAANTIATFILNVIADVINSAPAALDTLEELAAAINDDPDFHVTVMNEIGKKLDKAGGVVTGDLTVNGTFTADVTGNADTATKATGDKNGNDIAATYLPLAGGTMTGNLTISGNNPCAFFKDTRSAKGTPPASSEWNFFFFVKDKNNVSYGGFEHGYKSSGENRINMIAYPGTNNTTSINAQIGVGFDSNGHWFTYAPTPGASDNSTKMATTAWVRTATGNTALNAATATKINGKTIPVVSSFDSTTGTLALTSLS